MPVFFFVCAKTKNKVYSFLIRMTRRRSGIRGPPKKQCASGTLKRNRDREEEESSKCDGTLNDHNGYGRDQEEEDDDYDNDGEEVEEDNGEEEAPVNSVEISGASATHDTSLSSITEVVSSNVKMSVVQKSNLLNWVDEFFSRHNKVMMLKDLEENLQLHLKICQEINVPNHQWVKYKKDALLTIKTQITERMSSHRKAVHLLYKGKHVSLLSSHFLCINLVLLFSILV